MIAPLWHTCIVFILYLAIYSLSAIRLGGHDLSSIVKDVPERVVLVICLDILIVLVVSLGLLFNETAIHDVFGERWAHRSHWLKDIIFGVFLSIIMFGIDLLITTIVPSSTSKFTPALNPRSEFDLVMELLLAVSGGFSEEVIFRGYFLRQIQSLTGSDGIALLGQGVLFVLAHGLHQELAGVMVEYSLGLIFGLVVIKRKSLLPAMVAHTLVDGFAFVLEFCMR